MKKVEVLGDFAVTGRGRTLVVRSGDDIRTGDTVVSDDGGEYVVKGVILPHRPDDDGRFAIVVTPAGEKN